MNTNPEKHHTGQRDTQEPVGSGVVRGPERPLEASCLDAYKQCSILNNIHRDFSCQRNTTLDMSG